MDLSIKEALGIHGMRTARFGGVQCRFTDLFLCANCSYEIALRGRTAFLGMR